MKRANKYYSIYTAIIFALFNVIAFATPSRIAGASKYTEQFWIGYLAVVIALLIQTFIANAALGEDDTKETTFLNLPLLSINYSMMMAIFAVGLFVMFNPNVKPWQAIIALSVILAFSGFAYVRAFAHKDLSSQVTNKIKAQTAFIKFLTIDAQCLVTTAKDEETKNIATKVFEAIRYSDPMSSDLLADIEASMKSSFEDFKIALNNDDATQIQETSKKLLALIQNRNTKCKALKS